jgi:cytosine/adenosine deaminase-related metal-dependent hydrolase
LILHRAAWVLPIAAPPIRDGWVAVSDGRVAAVGGPLDREPDGVSEVSHRTERRAILPGLVNAHVHLELSWARGTVPPAASMPAWASAFIARRRAQEHEPPVSIEDLRAIRAFGTSLVGDVTNTLSTYEPLAASDLHAAVFFEQLGFKSRDPAAQAAAAQHQIDTLPRAQKVRVHVVPHAPYSVSLELLRAIGNLHPGVVSLHLGESREEVQFLKDGTGPWRTLLEQLGAWDERWMPPACGPVEYIARAGLLNERLLAVHGVQLTDAELARVAAAGGTLVACPRSNLWTGAGAAPIARFYASGVRVAIGTDSLASVDDLNVFSELAAMKAAAPGVPAARLLESATRIGAEALGFSRELGTIAHGKRAELIAVRVPEGVEDVEEYLVGGIRAEEISWLAQD